MFTYGALAQEQKKSMAINVKYILKRRKLSSLHDTRLQRIPRGCASFLCIDHRVRGGRFLCKYENQ